MDGLKLRTTRLWMVLSYVLPDYGLWAVSNQQQGTTLDPLSGSRASGYRSWVRTQLLVISLLRPPSMHFLPHNFLRTV